jgi:hypothetical protein
LFFFLFNNFPKKKKKKKIIYSSLKNYLIKNIIKKKLNFIKVKKNKLREKIVYFILLKIFNLIFIIITKIHLKNKIF